VDARGVEVTDGGGGRRSAGGIGMATRQRGGVKERVETFAEQELKAIMENYEDDSVVVTNMGVFRGLDEIEEMFADFFDEFSREGATIEVDDTIVEGAFAYLLWHGETPDDVYEFCTDTFYIPEGSIDFQTLAGNVEPKD
jgi:hypothetical protein